MAARERRTRRSDAFKHNVELYGLEKAKLIAVCITKKKNDMWRESVRNDFANENSYGQSTQAD